MADPINIAIIGISGYGKNYFDYFQEYRDHGIFRLVAATVINQDEEAENCRLLREQGCEIFADFRAMLERWKGRLDLCVVPTGIDSHSEISIAAMQAGAHVQVEKPLAGSLDQGRAMVAAAEDLERLLCVGFQDVYAPYLPLIKKRLLDGSLGALRRIKALGIWPRGSNYYSRNGWAGRLKNGEGWVYDSPANNAFAHFLNLILFLAGPTPDEGVSATVERADLFRCRDIESFDTIALRARSEASSAELLFYATHSGHPGIYPEISVECENGEVNWTWFGDVIAKDGSGNETLIGQHDTQSNFNRMMDGVIDRVSGGNSQVFGGRSALNHTEVIAQLHERFDIHTVDDEYIDLIDHNGGVLPAIRQLEEDMRAAFESGKLFSEMEFRWALPCELSEV